jgi:hypothetical protein
MARAAAGVDPERVTSAGPRTYDDARSESGPPELVGLIRQRHAEHDARLAMANAIHRAEVVLVGRDADGLRLRLAERLRVCGGRVVDTVGPSTRFAVASGAASAAELAAVVERGVAVVGERDLAAMVEVYASLTCLDELRSAARRAREEATRSPKVALRSVEASAVDARAYGGFHLNAGRSAKRDPRLSDEELGLEAQLRRRRATEEHSGTRTRRLAG